MTASAVGAFALVWRTILVEEGSVGGQPRLLRHPPAPKGPTPADVQKGAVCSRSSRPLLLLLRGRHVVGQRRGGVLRAGGGRLVRGHRRLIGGGTSVGVGAGTGSSFWSGVVVSGSSCCWGSSVEAVPPSTPGMNVLTPAPLSLVPPVKEDTARPVEDSNARITATTTMKRAPDERTIRFHGSPRNMLELGALDVAPSFCAAGGRSVE